MKSFIITKVYNCLVLRFFFLFFSPKSEHIIEKKFWHAFPTNAQQMHQHFASKLRSFIAGDVRRFPWMLNECSLNWNLVLFFCFFSKLKRGKKTEKKFKGGVYDAALVFAVYHYDYYYRVCFSSVKTTVLSTCT